MSDYAIKVEGLGKKYLLQHQAESRRYVALRDVLAEKAQALFGNRKPETGNRKSVEEFWALKDVSFEVKQGEAVGIIGRNGAGKSTLLKVLSRITEPTTGRVRLRGRVASLLEVGTGFHPELTGRENIFLNGAILGMHRAEIKKRFDEIVAFAEVERFLDTPVKRYSSGMYMRLAFAVAAHLEPEILIVDEVLAVGDASFQKKCLGKMEDVSKGGRTVLFVSHNMESILRLCNRAVWLATGTVVKTGGPVETITHYLQHRQAQEAVINLANINRPSWVRGHIKFVTLTSLSQTEGVAWRYPFGTPFRFECKIMVQKPANQVMIAFAIFTSTGFELASAHAPLDPSGGKLEAGCCRINLLVEKLNLAPGSYTLNLGLRSEDGNEDFVVSAVGFDVITSTAAVTALADSIHAATIPQAVIFMERMPSK